MAAWHKVVSPQSGCCHLRRRLPDVRLRRLQMRQALADSRQRSEAISLGSSIEVLQLRCDFSQAPHACCGIGAEQIGRDSERLQCGGDRGLNRRTRSISGPPRRSTAPLRKAAQSLQPFRGTAGHGRRSPVMTGKAVVITPPPSMRLRTARTPRRVRCDKGVYASNRHAEMRN